MEKKRKPTHPGVVVKEDILKPLNLSVTDAAKDLGVTRKALSELLNERSSLSPDMAVRIARATKTSPDSWMTMQQKLDLWESEHKKFDIVPFPQIDQSNSEILEG
jgi:addiction module HigA family antidote